MLPTAAITERAKKPMVQSGGGSDEIFTKGYKYMFGMFPRASRQFISSVAFFKTIQPLPKTISVIMTNDAFSKTNAEGAIKDSKAAGFEIIESYQLPEQITDVSSVLASIRAKTPDILICTTHDANSLLISRQMAASNTNVPLLYQTLGPQLATYRETLGKSPSHRGADVLGPRLALQGPVLRQRPPSSSSITRPTTSGRSPTTRPAARRASSPISRP